MSDLKIYLKPEDEEKLKDCYSVPDVYAKNTDTHQYLNPISCHQKHVAKNIPGTVVNRLRRISSDRGNNDELFTKRAVEYKAYLLKSGHEESNIDEDFVKMYKKNI